jgi:hypothetical protein
MATDPLGTDVVAPEGAAEVADPPAPAPPADSPSAPTAASAWKTQEGELVMLPSGNVARLRRPSIMKMIRSGEMPNPLLSAAIGAMTGAQPLNADEIKQRAEFMTYLVVTAFVEPTVSRDDPPPEGALSLDALSDADQMFVTTWIGQEARALSSFREDGAGASPGDDGAGLRDQAE